MASSESPSLEFFTLDVFTSTPFLGNPLAVVLVPESKRLLMSQETKQRIAREFNLSETVFLHTLDGEPSQKSTTREIDIFLTTAEVPFAGHPTIGSAFLILRHFGWLQVNTLLTKAGAIPLKLLEDGGVLADVPHAVHIHRQTLGGVMSSSPAGVIDTIDAGLLPDQDTRAAVLAAPIVDIVKGMTFMLVRLPTLRHLANVRAETLDLSKVPGLLDDQDTFAARYYYVVTEESTGEGGRRVWAIQTRMVEVGLEDLATGSAACALAGYLSISERAVNGAIFNITQGVEMGRKSSILVETAVCVDAEGIVTIEEMRMGGKAVVLMSGSICWTPLP